MLSFDEYRAYFRLVRRKYEAELQRSLPSSVDTATPYPDPVAHCEICNWYPVCADRWTRDDYVALVAGIQRSQRKELKTWGVTTLASLAHIPLPLQHKPSRGNVATFERLREQARLQLETRSTGQPQYEILQIENGHGLAALPSPSRLTCFSILKEIGKPNMEALIIFSDMHSAMRTDLNTKRCGRFRPMKKKSRLRCSLIR